MTESARTVHGPTPPEPNPRAANPPRPVPTRRRCAARWRTGCAPCRRCRCPNRWPGPANATRRARRLIAATACHWCWPWPNGCRCRLPRPTRATLPANRMTVSGVARSPARVPSHGTGIRCVSRWPTTPTGVACSPDTASSPTRAKRRSAERGIHAEGAELRDPRQPGPARVETARPLRLRCGQ